MSLVESMITIKMSLREFTGLWSKANLSERVQNNNFVIPEDSRLHGICRTEIDGKAYIEWDDFHSRYIHGFQS